MGRIYLVRHAQASLLDDDYDQLSPLGFEQARRLGDGFAARRERFDVAVCGTLRRQSETARACLAQLPSPPTLDVDAAFDEYGHHELFANAPEELSSHAAVSARVRSSAAPRKDFHELVSRAFDQWVSGKDDTRRPRTWSAFRADCVAAVERVARRCGSGQTAIVVSSGGAIASICQHLMGVPDDRVADLHWVLYNASVTRLLSGPGRITLSTFNSVAHLEAIDPAAALVTYR
jgi:broad specificity phosphatase PhoE